MRIEVEKLYPEVKLPPLIYKDVAPEQLEIISLSENKAYFLVESLVEEVSFHCRENIFVESEEIEFEGAPAFRYTLIFEST